MPRRRVGALARKIASLSVREWRELLRAQWALIAAQRVVRNRVHGKLTIRDSKPASVTRARLGTNTTAHAHALGHAVRRAAKYGVFRPQCLARAIALQRLLSDDGIRGAMIRVGVKQAENGMLAHAWVELEGNVIGDTFANIREYAQLDELSVLS